MWLIFLPLLSKSCIPLECILLESNTCARKSLSTIMINSKPCDQGSICSASSLLYLNESPEESLSCQAKESDAEYDWSTLTYECGVRLPNKNFIQKGSLVECKFDDECLLTDGNFTTCECGADGKKYCVPAWDSDAFDGYWKACINGLSHIELKYWTLYKEYYPLWMTMGDLDCISGTIFEVSLMKNTISTPLSSSGYLYIILIGYLY